MSQSSPSTQRLVVEIDLPAESSLDQESARQVVRESFYVELYRLGKIGSGRAASLLGMDRSSFLDLLSAHDVSWFDDSMNVAQDAENARK